VDRGRLGFEVLLSVIWDVSNLVDEVVSGHGCVLGLIRHPGW
jgi:hypothetical protein